ncbi:UDP-N-acetylmuramoyl-L-alanyl-D-glutamate--2,6-diaminopimelate ligase [Pelagibaculum spongiae]|uniref:UDP-N-acetylmuramyl-tripeptide synthetase n=1 Tax=Pelagibaculum spongiae TaxID=2080658 RepID=A0A2V1GYM9_9GAMM|nr:UDP-N-acetylmuramoyl-L-alanyl-D-glutamate--2,6-diaminopimelate ligase [Pelagibaculum spongiae]PVZ71876.1 UDP-N-acetylmuramoyl-L-alanyl-D-glutamate--2,6-diaminopimelate ligase [Pelagibaculum spongiae]
MKSLAELLSGWCEVPDLQVKGLALDSRQIQPGYAFIAVQGNTGHGLDFLAQAEKAGACAIILDQHDDSAFQSDLPLVRLPKLKNRVGKLASRFYEHPSVQMPLVGITGTNGKTSCSLFLAHCWNQLGSQGGVIGTLGTGAVDSDQDAAEQLQETGNTTPDPVTVQAALAGMYQQGVRHAAIEVSSHAMDQHRVEGCRFETGLFTNLTQDHLDYHSSMEQYGEAKAKLFLEMPLQHAVVNLDDAFGIRLLQQLKQQRPEITRIGYSVYPQPQGLDLCDRFVVTEQSVLDQNGCQAKLNTSWGQFDFANQQLLASFNLSNLLGVIGCLLLDFAPEKVLQAASNLKPVPGRLNRFGGSELPLVVVDYAHTPDALQQVLSALRPLVSGKSYCVFGCGGDRDRNKRPQMAAAAEQNSDQLVITQDNSRFEDPAQIFADIKTGLQQPDLAWLEPERNQAIAKALSVAKAGDLIVVAGKGHEDYLDIQGKKSFWSDLQAVSELLQAKAGEQYV